MEYGAHLPLIELDAGAFSLGRLRTYADTAAGLGYSFLCANDHLLFARPWLDGPTALAAVVDQAEGMTLATTVCLPVIRGPVQTAKTLAALDVLSGGRLVVGVAAGLLRARLRGGRDPVRGALAAVRRGDAGAARAPARRSPARGRDVLLDTGGRARAQAGAATRATDLGRELGLAPGASARRPHRRRLARVGIQHDARRVPRRALVPRDAAPLRGEAGRRVPERPRDRLALRHRGSRRRRSAARRRPFADAEPPRRGAPLAATAPSN